MSNGRLCRLTPASTIMNVLAARRCCVPVPATAASFVPLVRSNVRRFRRNQAAAVRHHPQSPAKSQRLLPIQYKYRKFVIPGLTRNPSRAFDTWVPASAGTTIGLFSRWSSAQWQFCLAGAASNCGKTVGLLARGLSDRDMPE